MATHETQKRVRYVQMNRTKKKKGMDRSKEIKMQTLGQDFTFYRNGCCWIVMDHSWNIDGIKDRDLLLGAKDSGKDEPAR